MPTKREIDAENGRLVDAFSSAFERYRSAAGTRDWVSAGQEAQEALERLQEFARKHAPYYVTYPD